MKKKLLAILLCFVALTSSAFAENVVEATGGSCNVRSGPGLDYEKIGVVEFGESYEYEEYAEADERGVEWYCINFDGSEGWVSSRYCSVVSATAEQETETEMIEQTIETAEPAAEMDPERYEVCNCVKAVGGDCNIRTGPGNAYETIGALKKDSSVSYAGEFTSDDRGVEWYKIYTTGGTGWVTSVYAMLCEDESMPIVNKNDSMNTETNEGTDVETPMLVFNEP